MSLERGSRLISTAWRSGYAIPAFNVSNLETAQGVLAAAEEHAAPVILQASPGAIAYAGYDALSHLLLDLAAASSVPAIVHLDHGRDPDQVRRAIDDGFPSVMFDGSRLPLDENIATTRAIVEHARSRDVSVEGELGVIGARADTSADAALGARPTPEATADFVRLTGVDVVAPALGTIHGMPDDSLALDLEHLRAVGRACDAPIALHGGSGLDLESLAEAIAAGVAKVNVSSRITRALALGIRGFWDAEPDELDLRRFMAAGRDAVRQLAGRYFEATGAAGRAAAASAASRRPAEARGAGDAPPAWEPE